MSVVRAFALPVAIVFGGLGIFAGVVSAVGASQNSQYSDPYAFDETVTDGDSGFDDSSDDSFDAPEESTDEVTEEPVAPPASQSNLPSSCGEAFSETMKNTVQGAGLTLNPSWSIGEPSYGLSITDSNLRGTLAGLEQLKCRWLNPEGGGEVGIETTIAVVDASQGSAVNSRLASLGYTPLSELGGTRYVWERGATPDSDRYGESHIVVGGLWFATHWLSYGPNGYTADVVNTVLG